MDISPQRVRTAEFKTVKRGLDPDEVRAFLTEVATELERAQNQSTAMEARARAAVARLQELSEGTAATVATSEPARSDTAPGVETVVTPAASVDETETISRTLLLAQRTADTTIAEAQAEAERIAREAGEEASRTLDSTREMSARLLEEAREDARREGEAERNNMKTEVESLTARREFLESDVEHLERHLADERSRLREAATSLLELTERVPGGLGEVRRPLLSASDDADAGDTTEHLDEDADELDTAAVPITSDAHDSDADELGLGAELGESVDDGDVVFVQDDVVASRENEPEERNIFGS